MVPSGHYCNGIKSLAPGKIIRFCLPTGRKFIFKEFPGESGKFNMYVNAIVSNHAATGKVCLLSTLKGGRYLIYCNNY